jgi:NAD(P)H-dependent FMN reductase
MTEAVGLALIYGSVRPGRFCDGVAAWAADRIERDGRFVLDALDPATLGLTGMNPEGPGLDDARVRLGRADGFVIVTPEYNHSYPGALKLLIDAFTAEWQAKPVAFVSYGGVSGGLRAVEHLRHVFAELHATSLRDGVALANPWSYFADTAGAPRSAPQGADEAMTLMLDRLDWWARALEAARRSIPYVRSAA